MFRNAILAASLLANFLLVYIMFQPAGGTTNSTRMTCEQARSGIGSKKAVSEYADRNGLSFSKVHLFLTDSDYELRNITVQDGTVTFVYTSAAFYPSTCGIHLPGIDGGILRIATEITADPKVLSVW